MRKTKQAALEAVATHLSASLKASETNSPDAWLTVAGRRVGITVAALEPGAAGRADGKRPRLRFDRVVLRLVGDLKAALAPVVPDGRVVIVTVAAPIRRASKTAAALESRIRENLRRRAARVDLAEAIHENRVRVRILRGRFGKSAKVIGFVHNPDNDPEVILDGAQALLQCLGAATDKPMPARTKGARWLVIANKDGLQHGETWRQVYRQLDVPTDFAKILLVLADGRVEILTG